MATPNMKSFSAKVDDISLNTNVVDERLVASISRILTRNNIPCVLWGNYLLTVYGVPSIVDSIDFIVPDNLIAASVLALYNRGLAYCREQRTCSEFDDSRPSPPPAAHFHFGSEHTISLYKQSSVLGFLPSLRLSSKSTISSPDIILASDSHLPPPRPGRGHGAFRSDTFPVHIPTANRLLEAYIRLLARTTPDSQYKIFWMAMINYIEEYVDGDGFLDEGSLENRCRIFYSGLKSGKLPVAILMKDLRDSFA